MRRILSRLAGWARCHVTDDATGSGVGAAPTPLGAIEPHAAMLTAPPADQMLFKVMKVEHLLASLDGSYLHFNRVDRYADFPGADANDGAQLHQDRPGNAGARFEKAPHFSAADYYDQARRRTYACCFSLENSPHIWSEYANGSERGKVCLVFRFGRLRARLNQTLDPTTAMLAYQGVPCRQFFSVNYGIVSYVDWANHQANDERLPNPVAYTYLKDSRFSAERELRVSLAAPGIGKLVFGGTEFDFPRSIPVAFDFRAAFADGTLERLELAPDGDRAFLEAELSRRGIAVVADVRR